MVPLDWAELSRPRGRDEWTALVRRCREAPLRELARPNGRERQPRVQTSRFRVPQAHRWSMFQILFNIVPTGRRYRFGVDGEIGCRYLCNAGEDSLAHLSECPIVSQCFDHIALRIGAMIEWETSLFFLGEAMDGGQIQLIYILFAWFAPRPGGDAKGFDGQRIRRFMGLHLRNG